MLCRDCQKNLKKFCLHYIIELLLFLVECDILSTITEATLRACVGNDQRLLVVSVIFYFSKIPPKGFLRIFIRVIAIFG
jgi:hypothetical protein